MTEKIFETILDIDQHFKINQWQEASQTYYEGSEVIMSDSEFDELTEEIISWNLPEITKFIESRIYIKGEGMIEVNQEFNQTQEMISLMKIKFKDMSSISEIRKFFISNRKQLKYSPKFDGGALKININADFTEVERIISRGGVDVTEKFKNLPSIRKTLNFKERIVAGELVIKKTIFNEKYSTLGDNDYEYENARNFVGSLIKNESFNKEILNDITFIPCTNGVNPLLNEVWKLFKNDDLYNLQNMIRFYKSDDFPYLCDGIVISYDEEGERQIKDNYPLNMVAIKFPANRAKSKVIGFEWTQKKSGNLTPKVLIEPVKLDGSTLTCANGYNYQKLLENHIGIGSEVEVEKSGDIIPIIAKVLSRSSNIIMPDCDYIREGKHLVAMNMEESRKYKFTLGLKLLQLDGIGPVLAEQVGEICDYNIIQLFDNKFKPNICAKLGGGANWLKFSEFYNIKNITLDRLIHLLQFKDVGPKLALKVALLITKKSNDTSNISSYVISNVAKGEGFEKIKESIQVLKTFGVNILPPMEINEDTISFEMTGNPPGITKQEFVKKFQEVHPNAIHSTLTRDTTYLFCDDLSSNTGKINKARKYNVKIILYSQALKNQL